MDDRCTLSQVLIKFILPFKKKKNSNRMKFKILCINSYDNNLQFITFQRYSTNLKLITFVSDKYIYLDVLSFQAQYYYDSLCECKGFWCKCYEFVYIMEWIQSDSMVHTIHNQIWVRVSVCVAFPPITLNIYNHSQLRRNQLFIH